MKSSFISMLCAVLLASPVSAARKAQFQALLTNGASVSGGTYSTGGGLTVAVSLLGHQGKTLVCGVWALSPQQSVLSKHGERRVLDSGSIFVDGKRLVHGFLFMNKVEPSADYTGQEAGCVLTKRPWVEGDEDTKAKIRIPQQVVQNEAGGNPGEPGGFIVIFKQTGPGASVK